MNRMLTISSLAALCLAPAAAGSILIVVERGYYDAYTAKIDTLVNDIYRYDNKSAKVVSWQNRTGTNVDQCRPLWQLLADTYSTRFGGDALEGAVLVGDIPVPLTTDGTSTASFDYYYMDVFDSLSDERYLYGDLSPFSLDAAHPGYFALQYNQNYYGPGGLGGDGRFDIWVSRIYGPRLSLNHHLRSSAPGGNAMTVLAEYQIYNEYLDRLHRRYTEPAQIPSRAFAMGGPTNMYGSLQYVLGLQGLSLPMYAEFANGGECPSNWVSQLQAGPKGNTNYGAYSCQRFPAERNKRAWTYTSLPDPLVAGHTFTNLDNTGWEWAGLFAHSSPYMHWFKAGGWVYNGTFLSGTLGPYWGNSQRSTGGYKCATNTSGYCYWFDPTKTTSIYGWGTAQAKSAHLQYKVHANGVYSIYIYYTAATDNASNDTVRIWEAPVDASGQPIGEYAANGNDLKYGLSLRTHVQRDGTTQWERVFSNVTMSAGNLLLLQIDVNERNGKVIADAARFACSAAGVNDIVDNSVPTAAPAADAVYSTQGFYTSDWVDRGFEDMQDEDATNHAAFSKSPFFLLNACDINDYIYTNGTMDNLGNLYALGHNGLISMGTSDPNYERSYAPFVNALKDGGDFGQALRAQANACFGLYGMYVLLGSGTLRAAPYVQFGSTKIQNTTITTTTTKSSTNPVLVRGVTVTATGKYTLTSTVTQTPQNCAHSAIVIRPETTFKLGCYADIKAN